MITSIRFDAPIYDSLNRAHCSGHTPPCSACSPRTDAIDVTARIAALKADNARLEALRDELEAKLAATREDAEDPISIARNAQNSYCPSKVARARADEQDAARRRAPVEEITDGDDAEDPISLARNAQNSFMGGKAGR